MDCFVFNSTSKVPTLLKVAGDNLTPLTRQLGMNLHDANANLWPMRSLGSVCISEYISFTDYKHAWQCSICQDQ